MQDWQCCWLLQFHSCTCAPFQCSSRAGSAAPGAGPAAGEESWLLRCAVELERWKNRELAACRVQCAHLDHLFLSNFVSCREKIPYQWHFLKTQRLAQRIQYKQAAVPPPVKRERGKKIHVFFYVKTHVLYSISVFY